MTTQVPLNNEKHKNTKIITRHGEGLDDNITFAVVFPHEFKRLQADYPLFFRKNEQRQCFECIALFGLQEKENLFITANEWEADYIPLTVERRPFMIGFQQAEKDGETVQQPLVLLDTASPRLDLAGEGEGEAIFLPHGGHTPYFEKITGALQDIFKGDNHANEFIAALEKHELLEAFTLQAQLHGDNKLHISGFHTINEDKFNQLSDEVLGEFHRKGYLGHIYMMFASIGNINKLLRRKNEKIKAAN